MPTKYILVGGHPQRAPDNGKKLVEDMIAGFDEPVKMLLCYFARPKYQWGPNMILDKVFFRHHSNGKKITFELAQVETFIDQLKWANE